jgi:uncharacterized membrane protein YhiD involved in acid resistance
VSAGPSARRGLTRWLRAGALVLTCAPWASAVWAAQPATPPANPTAGLAESAEGRHAAEAVTIYEAVLSLPIAAALGAALAFRPQRRGTPPRNTAVIQTQIILAVVGALVMLVVGASLARAFGIVGAASLVRYRSKIDDPKDAGVMLSCLAIGLASGVGIYWVATLSTAFVWSVLWLLESLEPAQRREFLLKIKAASSEQLREAIEQVLRKNGAQHDLRTSAQDELTFSVNLPVSKKTNRLTNAILAVAQGNEIAVEWSDKKAAKAGA